MEGDLLLLACPSGPGRRDRAARGPEIREGAEADQGLPLPMLIEERGEGEAMALERDGAQLAFLREERRRGGDENGYYEGGADLFHYSSLRPD